MVSPILDVNLYRSSLVDTYSIICIRILNVAHFDGTSITYYGTYVISRTAMHMLNIPEAAWVNCAISGLLQACTFATCSFWHLVVDSICVTMVTSAWHYLSAQTVARRQVLLPARWETLESGSAKERVATLQQMSMHQCEHHAIWNLLIRERHSCSR